MVVADESPRVFSERLTPSLLSWLIAPGFGAIFFIMCLPLGLMPAIPVGLVAIVLAAIGLWALAAKVELTHEWLTVGRARIDVASLGEVQACDAKEIAHWMGPGSDARSYVLTRPWVHTGVYVEQTHPGDPTPYWLFSLRSHEEFVEALTRVKEKQ